MDVVVAAWKFVAACATGGDTGNSFHLSNGQSCESGQYAVSKVVV